MLKAGLKVADQHLDTAVKYKVKRRCAYHPQNTKKPAAIHQDDDEETSRRLSTAVIANWNSMEWTKAQSLWGGPTKTFCVEDEPEQLVFSYWTSPTKAFVSSV